MLAKLPRRGLWLISDEIGAPLSYDVMNDRVTALNLAANVARPPKPLHCLRHTFGTVMAKQVPLKTLSELMGHADIETTLRYVDVSEDDKRAAIAKVFGSGSRWAAHSTRDLEARATS